MYIIISEPDGHVLLTQRLDEDGLTTLGELDQQLNRSYVRLHAQGQTPGFLALIENWRTAPSQMVVYVRHNLPTEIVQQAMDWAQAAWDELKADKLEPVAPQPRPAVVSAVVSSTPRGWDS